MLTDYKRHRLRVWYSFKQFLDERIALDADGADTEANSSDDDSLPRNQEHQASCVNCHKVCEPVYKLRGCEHLCHYKCWDDREITHNSVEGIESQCPTCEKKLCGKPTLLESVAKPETKPEAKGKKARDTWLQDALKHEANVPPSPKLVAIMATMLNYLACDRMVKL